MEKENNKNYESKPLADMNIDELDLAIHAMKDMLDEPGENGLWDDESKKQLEEKIQEATDLLAQKTLIGE